MDRQVGCIVLAAGGGRRFGGCKQLARLGGRPLLEHVLEAAGAVQGLHPAIVVLGAHADEISARVTFGRFRPVLCERWRAGQAESLRVGVAALSSVDGAVILLGDQPLITRVVIERAVAEWVASGREGLRATFGGKPGHPVVLGAQLLARVGEIRGDRGARDLLDQARVRLWEAQSLCEPADVDTPADLETVRLLAS